MVWQPKNHANRTVRRINFPLPFCMKKRTMPTPKPSAAHSKDATASVKSVMASLAESWNRHDVTAFAAALRDDADFVNVIGMHWQGRHEIEASPWRTSPPN
jgi:hypothetical protein